MNRSSDSCLHRKWHSQAHRPLKTRCPRTSPRRVPSEQPVAARIVAPQVPLGPVAKAGVTRTAGVETSDPVAEDVPADEPQQAVEVRDRAPVREVAVALADAPVQQEANAEAPRPLPPLPAPTEAAWQTQGPPGRGKSSRDRRGESVAGAAQGRGGHGESGSYRRSQSGERHRRCSTQPGRDCPGGDDHHCCSANDHARWSCHLNRHAPDQGRRERRQPDADRCIQVRQCARQSRRECRKSSRDRRCQGTPFHGQSDFEPDPATSALDANSLAGRNGGTHADERSEPSGQSRGEGQRRRSRRSASRRRRNANDVGAGHSPRVSACSAGRARRASRLPGN